MFITKEKAKKDENSKSNTLKVNQYKDFDSYLYDACKQRKFITNQSNQNMKEDEIKNRKRVYSTIKTELLQTRALLSQHNFTQEEPYIDKKLEDISKKKKINLNVWISEAFPIKISHFIPLLHILSFTSTEFSKLKSTLCARNLPFKSFPLKISYPLKLSFYVLLSVMNFSMSKPNKAIFDSNYFNTDIYGSKDNTNVCNGGSDVVYKTSVLDDNAAHDFYDNYFKEKNLQKKKKLGKIDNFEDSDDSATIGIKVNDFINLLNLKHK